MSLPHSSVATIDSPEFINLQPLDINPMMSKCEIKVFYVGENRNGSYIKKEVATEMAKTLRGAPIVGYFKEDKGDFTDHGDKITIEGGEIHFECVTKPYGFVSPTAEVWFQKFTEQDEFGTEVEREYLMTTGFLWTGQYPEAQAVLDSGKPQSMELDDSTLEGHWASNSENIEFFIINDAVISKLCILGDDVEPCFEGASVTAPTRSTNFTLDKEFKQTLFSMMKELEFALMKGDDTVEENINTVSTEEEAVVVEESTEDTVVEEAAAAEESVEETVSEETEDASNSEFVVKEEFSEDSKDKEEDEDKEEKDATEDEEKELVKNSLHTDEEYNALQTSFEELNAKFSALEQEYTQLVEFKNEVEDKQKDALIAKFYMLSDDDKKDVIENKRNYSLEDIEAKLAVICYRKKVNFDSEVPSNFEDTTTEEKSVVTFNLNDAKGASTPDWVKAVEEAQKNI